MPTHAERQLLPYRPEQMFDLVADVGQYPKFLPWCVGARVLSRSPTALRADLTIGFGPFRETFRSQVGLERPHRVLVTYENGPFRFLNNEWRFSAVAEGCEVDFHVAFEFRSRVLQAAIGVVFAEAVRRMVGAFQKRAREVYAVPAIPPSGSRTETAP
ncbi:MAG: type II toxin-antitoxin system RatA family toxin [Rhodospirillales bacterium]|nr:type II toxin-antitoxin system RatA family toxin [Rhodospirillales bacterium]